jgi:acetoin utilization deacetylase AcuC-like enzyme
MTTTVYFNDRYTASVHAAEPTRKSGLIAATLEGHPEVRLADPAPHRDQALVHLAEVHDARYLEAIRTGDPFELAESQGFAWDPGIYTMAVEHAAGQVAAVNEVLTTGARIAGSLSSGQHHARRGEGSGFCTFNGLAASTHEAFRLGAERVLVLDFDAHGGGGTRSVTDPKRVVQVDVTVSPFDLWEPTSTDDHFELAEADDYLAAIDRALNHASSIGDVDLVIYNAGMDPINAEVSANQLAERERRVAEWAAAAEVPLAYLLAGGYLWGGFDWDDIVALHRLTIDTFVN